MHRTRPHRATTQAAARPGAVRRALRIAPALLLALPLAACGSDDGGGGASSGGDGGQRTLTVFAAASLTKTFTTLEKTFEKENPGVDVKLSFGGSSDLVAQITEGAEADVFASADTKNMDKLVAADLAEGTPAQFATNKLTIITLPRNPGGISGLADFGDPKKTTVVCAPEVPCGAAALKLADLAGIKLTPASEEQSVTDVLAKVLSGEADAGLVYVTDAADGVGVDTITPPESDKVINDYPIVAVKGSKHAELATKWVELVTGSEGQQVLKDAGFGPPAS